MKSAGVLIVVMQVGWMGVACAGPADDAKAIAQCVEKAGDQFPGACIGIVADPCIKNAFRAGNADDANDAKACAKRELAVWRARMTKAIALIGKGATKPMVAAVAAAQKTLAASQDSLCPQFNVLDPGMAMGGEDYCRLQETARRVLMLERFAAAVSEH